MGKFTQYYDHNLTAVEKGKLIDIANNEQSAITSGFGTTPDTKSTTNSQCECKELVSILQTNVSKVVDANGEPMVVYHDSNWKGITSISLYHKLNFGEMLRKIETICRYRQEMSIFAENLQRKLADKEKIWSTFQ